MAAWKRQTAGQHPAWRTVAGGSAGAVTGTAPPGVGCELYYMLRREGHGSRSGRRQVLTGKGIGPQGRLRLSLQYRAPRSSQRGRDGFAVDGLH